MAYLQTACKGYLAHDTLHKRRLSFTVLADKSHFFASFDGESDMIENSMGTVILAHFVTDNGVITGAKTRRKLQMHHFVVHFVNLYGHYLFKLLDTLLHLHGLGGLIAESVYESFDVGYLLLLVLVGP